MSKPGPMRPILRRWRLFVGAAVLGGLAAGGCYCQRPGNTPAAPPGPAAPPAPAGAAVAAPVVSVPSDYYQRVVAYLYDGEQITRADLGEYLIPRCGIEKLDLLIKRKIIDRACRARGVDVTAAEIDAALGEYLRGMNI